MTLTRLAPLRLVFLISLYAGCLLAFEVGISWTTFWVVFLVTHIRGFGITGGYHRYFAHRSYKTSRVFQFILAILGASALQGGPLSWCAIHRFHHRYSDQAEDIISPVQKHFWWTQFALWGFYQHPLSNKKIKGFHAYPEIIWLDKLWLMIPFILAIFFYGLGEWINELFPRAGTSGLQMLVWGFFIGTVYIHHVTSAVNSWCHLWGSQPYDTGDNSRNSFIVGLLAMGEGWHNNHHRFPTSERQGLLWWEIDITHYILKFLSWFRIVFDLRTPKEELVQRR